MNGEKTAQVEVEDDVAAPAEQDQEEVENPKVVDVKGYEPKAKARFWKAFNVEYRDESGNMKAGVFVCKRLTLGEAAEVGVRVAQLSGGLNVPLHVQTMNNMIATLEHSLIEKPEWFEPTKLYDFDLLLRVYTEVAKFDRTFRAPVG